MKNDAEVSFGVRGVFLPLRRLFVNSAIDNLTGKIRPGFGFLYHIKKNIFYTMLHYTHTFTMETTSKNNTRKSQQYLADCGIRTKEIQSPRLTHQHAPQAQVQTMYGPALDPSVSGDLTKLKRWAMHKGAGLLMMASFFLCFTGIIEAQTPVTETFTTAGTFNWTAPAGVTSVTIECWGAGGGGGDDGSSSNNGGGGGGGGAYSKVNSYTVTPENSYSYTVGTQGSANGGNGGASSFNTSTCVAAGGTGGTAGNTGTGGAGGTTSASEGDIVYAGGTGANGGSTGGGGGGSAGTGGNGNNGSGQTGATAVTGGGPGGNGASQSSGSAPATGPGGGGGGADYWYTNVSGGAGYAGQVKITYTLPGNAYTSSGTYTFTAPSGVRKVTVEAWGGGGGGGGDASSGGIGNGGGGGGAYARVNSFAVTPGNPYSAEVGAGGAGGDGNNGPGGNGGSSSFNSSTCVAFGGSGGQVNSAGGAGGAGGSGAGSTGDIKYSGGNGAAGDDYGGGGGGSSAGTGSNGNPASGASGGAAVTGGGAGGNGRADDTGLPGLAPGGGGGGAEYNAVNPGGAGADGKIMITWECPSILLSSASGTDNQTVCSNSAITDITYTISDNYVSANVTGLPSGVTSAVNGNTLTISGIPSTATGSPFNYTIILTKPTGCDNDAVVNGTITVNASPIAKVLEQTNVKCNAGNDGTITIQVLNGTGPNYQYSADNGTTWKASTDNPYIYGGLEANKPYRIVVKDNNQCESIHIP